MPPTYRMSRDPIVFPGQPQEVELPFIPIWPQGRAFSLLVALGNSLLVRVAIKTVDFINTSKWINLHRHVHGKSSKPVQGICPFAREDIRSDTGTREFCPKFRNLGFTRVAIRDLVSKCKRTCNIADENRSGRPSITEETVERIEDAITRSISASTRRLGRELGVPQSTAKVGDRAVRHGMRVNTRMLQSVANENLMHGTCVIQIATLHPRSECVGRDDNDYCLWTKYVCRANNHWKHKPRFVGSVSRATNDARLN
ncbi:hypothetical protein J6590_105310 [Homalodisca vitripennis]|nr:hypothetical protein J6590_105310 [Homalodisca vitripennis]